MIGTGYSTSLLNSRALAEISRRIVLAAALALVGAAPLHLAGCAAVSHPIATARAGTPPTYLDPAALDLVRLLPPAPANDSKQTRVDLETMLKIQASRTPAEAERARADAAVSIERLADALNDPQVFAKNDLPRTHALFKKILASEVASVGAAKRYYERPRPFVLEPRLEPVIARPHDGSYPSGHSSWVRSVALVLADMVPERRAQILARADEYAHNRVVAGVHYPSDVEAGKLAGTAIATALYASPDFRRDLAAARSELRRALGLPSEPHASSPPAAQAGSGALQAR